MLHVLWPHKPLQDAGGMGCPSKPRPERRREEMTALGCIHHRDESSARMPGPARALWDPASYTGCVLPREDGADVRDVSPLAAGVWGQRAEGQEGSGFGRQWRPSSQPRASARPGWSASQGPAITSKGFGGGEGPWGRGQMQNVVPDGRRSGVGRVDRDGHPRHMAQLCVRSRGQAAAQGPFTRAHFLEFCFTNELANVLHFVRRATDISQCNVQ